MVSQKIWVSWICWIMPWIFSRNDAASKTTSKNLMHMMHMICRSVILQRIWYNPLIVSVEQWLRLLSTFYSTWFKRYRFDARWFEMIRLAHYITYNRWGFRIILKPRETSRGLQTSERFTGIGRMHHNHALYINLGLRSVGNWTLKKHERTVSVNCKTFYKM